MTTGRFILKVMDNEKELKFYKGETKKEQESSHQYQPMRTTMALEQQTTCYQ